MFAFFRDLGWVRPVVSEARHRAPIFAWSSIPIPHLKIEMWGTRFCCYWAMTICDVLATLMVVRRTKGMLIGKA
jgi:hypothetical protein